MYVFRPVVYSRRLSAVNVICVKCGGERKKKRGGIKCLVDHFDPWPVLLQRHAGD